MIASASVMNASVQNAFAFAVCFYQSALHLCESKSREPTELVTELTGWAVRFDTTDVCRRRVEWAPKWGWCPCEVACTAMRRERHCFLSLYSSGEENHLQPLGVCSLEPAWFSPSAAMLHLTCRQVLLDNGCRDRQSWFIVVYLKSELISRILCSQTQVFWSAEYLRIQ